MELQTLQAKMAAGQVGPTPVSRSSDLCLGIGDVPDARPKRLFGQPIVEQGSRIYAGPIADLLSVRSAPPTGTHGEQ
jgi:hypothetical protein